MELKGTDINYRKPVTLKEMVKRWEIRSLIGLESLFALCAASVVVYKLLGIFDY